jgi:hypothetical protein
MIQLKTNFFTGADLFRGEWPQAPPQRQHETRAAAFQAGNTRKEMRSHETRNNEGNPHFAYFAYFVVNLRDPFPALLKASKRFSAGTKN